MNRIPLCRHTRRVSDRTTFVCILPPHDTRRKADHHYFVNEHDPRAQAPA